ncbi:enoyl-CoA hydratase/isomerase family protein [Kribbella solani]|uniref:2-(1,2-epoxy-1,2-dihydrophenyl)acetyl-CoA isomerase n=1 Tax=Kribbella solani TaxID=236067 RepID=A0A841DPW5_9ACTN|nr:enoyl-CoA hydratase-related protein [Kribbella solani]MBB5979931.1 2-(1,2-epoxy-1,2-dihydrophenyl)acetyl-CoA isomerase [Kribbella solani]
MTDGVEPILLSQEGAIARVTLNRPSRRNALDPAAWQLLRETFEKLAADRTVRVVVLTGAEGSFCAGSDLGGPKDDHPLERMRRLNNAAVAVHEFPKPLIARVDGPAVGAGANLALASDFVVASPAARFGEIFARRGLSVDFGGSWLLPRLVGLQQAKRLLMLPDVIDAEEARELGLVTWLKPAAELDEFVTELAGRLAALPPVAVAQSKALLNQGADQTLRQALDNEARAQAVNLATEDVPIAYRAFLDKVAEPQYTGRWAVR